MLVGVMTGPIKALMGVNETFKPFYIKGVSLLIYKLVFIGINMGIMTMGMYKLYGIGLLPLSPADHVDWIPKKEFDIMTIDLTI